MLIAISLAGWMLAGGLGLWVYRLRQHTCPVEQPTKAVLVNSAGLPESLRTLRGAPPVTYSRPKGRDAAILYHRIGTAAVYQPKA